MFLGLVSILFGFVCLFFGAASHYFDGTAFWETFIN